MAAELELDNMARFATMPNVDTGLITDATAVNTLGIITNAVDCFTAGTHGALVDSVQILSNDTVNKTAHLYVYTGVKTILIGVFTITAGAGTNGTLLPIDPLSNANASSLMISNQGKRYLRLEANWTIKVGILAAPSAGKFIWTNVSGLDYEA